MRKEQRRSRALSAQFPVSQRTLPYFTKGVTIQVRKPPRLFLSPGALGGSFVPGNLMEEYNLETLKSRKDFEKLVL